MNLKYSYISKHDNIKYEFDIYSVVNEEDKLITVRACENKKYYAMWEFGESTSFNELPFPEDFKVYLFKFIKNIIFI